MVSGPLVAEAGDGMGGYPEYLCGLGAEMFVSWLRSRDELYVSLLYTTFISNLVSDKALSSSLTRPMQMLNHQSDKLSTHCCLQKV